MTDRRRGVAPDDVFAELVRVTHELDSAEDALERAALRSRLHDLRALAAREGGDDLASMSDDALAAEIARCDRSLARLRAARFDPSTVAGATGYGGGIDPMLAATHNRKVDTDGGREQLEHRRTRLVEEQRRRRSS